MKRSPEHEEAHKEVKEDAPESTSPGVPESTTPEPKRARGRRAVENDENATTSAPKENSPHMKRSPEHEEAHKEAKEDALESYSPGVPESTTPEPKRARGRRAVENDENATTSAPKENSPHMKRSPEHEEAHKKVKEDAPESTSPGVPESTTPEPKRARGRRAVENDENATTSAPKENSPHMKRSPEHEEAHKKVKEDAPESTSPGVPESTTPEPKRARGRRAVENDENATTSAPKENSSHMKRSPEHEEAHKEVKEDAPESTSPGVPESTTPEPKRARGRRAVENDENATTSAPKENSPHMKRSPEHEEVHKEVKEDALESTSPGVPEPTEPKKARRRRSVEHDENATTSASKEDSPDVKRSAEYEEAHKEAKEDALESTSPGVPESTTSEPKRARRRRSVEHDENATTSAPKEDSPHVKRSPEHEEPHKEAKEDAVESSSPGVPESTTSEPKKTRKRRAVENDENATTSAPKENSPHVKRSPEHEEAHKEAKEDALESTSPGVPESATPEPKKARRRRSVEHDENATTSAPKEDSPHVKRSPEHEEPHKEAKEDAIESTSPGVHESTTSEPKRARRRRSVEHDENATTSAPKEDSPHVKRSPEHEEPHKEAKEDALESSAPGVPESATPEPKKARRKRAVENDENATTSAPEENSPYVKRSPEHEEAQREAKEDVPEASSPGVTDSPTSEQKKEHNRRSVGDCSHTFFASKDNNGHVKRSVEHEGTHQDTTSPVTLKSETSEPPKEDTRRRRDTEHEKTTEANSKNIIRSPESAGTYQENREKRSAKDEMLAQHDTTGENVKEKATKEPILKREVSRRRRATEDSKHVKSKEEDAPEETRDSNTTAEPCEKKAKRDTEQEPTSALNDGKKPDELQEHAPKPRVEALIMGGEGNCCKGRHPPGMHGTTFSQFHDK
ncbi:unnamed protein product [Callosobruchus maculatus]|uniref:Uncharacterized protein n=1 Tax=Callosobruchus maculatus TaxID=64391 RepID=A0A653BWD2_CALMS|nr:unnamed protein product [Callosobruchus maculatus]